MTLDLPIYLAPLTREYRRGMLQHFIHHHAPPPRPRPPFLLSAAPHGCERGGAGARCVSPPPALSYWENGVDLQRPLLERPATRDPTTAAAAAATAAASSAGSIVPSE